jgi:hypothetical protein
MVVIAGRAGIPAQFPANAGAVDSYVPRNVRLRETSFL